MEECKQSSKLQFFRYTTCYYLLENELSFLLTRSWKSTLGWWTEILLSALPLYFFSVWFWASHLILWMSVFFFSSRSKKNCPSCPQNILKGSRWIRTWWYTCLCEWVYMSMDDYKSKIGYSKWSLDNFVKNRIFCWNNNLIVFISLSYCTKILNCYNLYWNLIWFRAKL